MPDRRRACSSTSINDAYAGLKSDFVMGLGLQLRQSRKKYMRPSHMPELHIRFQHTAFSERPSVWGEHAPLAALLFSPGARRAGRRFGKLPD
jgi:hypothetical protein